MEFDNSFSSIRHTKLHGFDIHLASLRSNNSCGIGEYHDLLPLISWCKKIGFQIIQLLPINDSGFDPSPYNALSSCALNPIYLSLRDLPHVTPPFLEQLRRFEPFLSSPYVPYQEVLHHKLDLLFYYYRSTFSEIKTKQSYQDFIKQSWLLPYAVFKVLKDLHHFSLWETWEKKERDPSQQFLHTFYEKEKERCDYYLFLQYLCFEQMSSVHAFAKQEGIKLMGDIPILISLESADVWAERSYFNTKFAAGVPPDQYNEEGQYWGFPLYNWETIIKDHFSFWERRLKVAEHFYDLYRLDHIVGFFHIWAIQRGGLAIEGHYLPSQKEIYLKQGTHILSSLLQFTSMIPIGEDLGTIPQSVRDIMADLEISSTKVIRWEKDWEGSEDFTPIEDYPALSLTTLSTHDSETLGMWWTLFPDEALLFCKNFDLEYEPTFSYTLRKKVLMLSHKTQSCFHINLLQEYLNLFPQLSWDNPDQERINIPGKVLSTNWTYRYKPYLEEIIAHHELLSDLKEFSD